jgi:dTDP-4-amino-4,6-dideoxygalactose transaminase
VTDGPIPYRHQSIDEDDIDAVVTVLRGDWLTQGPSLEAFEAALCDVTEAGYAVAFANGTAALHAACAAAELGAGDLVATSTLSFVASANCASYVGADVALVDIDPDTLNLDLSRVPKQATGLVAVHFAGLPVDLRQMARRPRTVIEDAAHALGAITPDGPVGNCAHSDMCCFSFHPVKAITTAEGGAVTTNDPVLADRLRRFRNHGIVRRPEVGGWCYDVVELGWNYRLPDLQSALGVNQLKKLAAFIERRNALAARYRSRLGSAPLRLPPAAPDRWTHAYHLFAVRLPDRDGVYDEMRAKGIGVQVHYVPIHRHTLHRRDAKEFPNAEAAADELLSLPLFPALTEEQQDRVIDALHGTGVT